MEYIVYLTVNTINKHIYVGVHKTVDSNIWDGYLGCGVNAWKPCTYSKPKTVFQYAVRKYGVKAFKRITIASFSTDKEAYNLEEIIVDKNFIKRPDVYNMMVGGYKGPDNSIEIHQYSLEGKYIKSWGNAQMAAEYFNTNNNVIRRAVNYKTTSYGYLWSEDYVDVLDLSEYTVVKQNEFVYKFDLNNNLVDQYESVAEAGRQNGTNPHEISHAISGRSRSKGFYYSYNKDFKINEEIYSRIKNVYLYNLDGTFFKEFSSPSECCRFFGTNHTSGVYRSIRTGGLYKGYQISKIKHDCMKVIAHSKVSKKVAQYDTEGNLIKIFESTMKARKEIGESIVQCLKGRQKTAKGYVFKYYEE